MQGAARLSGRQRARKTRQRVNACDCAQVLAADVGASVLAVSGTIAHNSRSDSAMNRERVETTEDFKARIAAMIGGDKTEHITGARRLHPMLVRKKRAV